MKPRWSVTSRYNLIFIVLVTSIPALGLLIYSSYGQRQQAMVESRQEITEATQLVSAEYSRLVEGARQLLTTLAQVDAIRGNDTEVCNRFLTDLEKNFEQYASIGVADLQGNLICSAIRSNSVINVSDRGWFQGALQTRGFAPGEYQVGRLSGRPSVNFGFPVFGKTGEVTGVVFTALDLTWLSQMAIAAQLPPGALYTIVDSHGVILSSSVDPQKWIGADVTASGLFRQAQGGASGTVDAPGWDGAQQLSGYRRLSGEFGDVLVTVSLPSQLAYAQANRSLAASLSNLLVITLLALLAAWSGGYLFLGRKVRSLTRTARQMAAGDFSVRTGIPHARDDLGNLASTFDEMGVALQAQRQSMNRALDALKTSEEHYRRVVELSPEAIHIHSDGKYVYLNPACVRLFGAESADQLVGGSVYGVVPPEVREGVQERVQKLYSGEITETRVEQQYLRLDGSRVDVDLLAAAFVYDGKPAVQVIVRDISERKRMEAIQNRRNEELAALYETSLEINAQLDRSTLLKAIVERATTLLRAHRGAIYLLRPDGETLELVVKHNLPGIPDSITLNIGEGLSGIVARTGELVEVSDYPAWEERSHAFDAIPIKRVMGVPLRVGGRVIGVITVMDDEKGGFYSEEEARLASLFADQAAVAVENARLYAQVQNELQVRAGQEAELKRLVDELTALHGVAKAQNETGNLDELIAQVTGIIGTRLFPEDFGIALIYAAEGMVRMHPSCHIARREKLPEVPLGVGITGRTIKTRQAQRVGNTHLDPDYIQVNPNVCSELCVPILVGDRVIGVINAESARLDAFSEADEHLMTVLASELGLGIQKQELFDAELRRSRELSALTQVSTALRVAQNRAEMIPIILDQVNALLSPTAVALMLQDPVRNDLCIELSCGEWSYLSGRRYGSDDLIFETLTACGAPYLANVGDDPVLRDYAAFQKVHTVMAVPLIAQDSVIGVLVVGQETQLSSEEQRLLTAIGDVAATAIQRVTLFDQTTQRLQRLSILRTVDMAITGSIDAKFTIGILLEEIVSNLKLDAADVLRYNPASRTLDWSDGRGFRGGALVHARLKLPALTMTDRALPQMRACLDRQPVVIANLEQEDSDRLKLLAQDGFVSGVILPFVAKGQVKGLLEIFHRTPLAFDREWLEFLESLAQQAAIALDNVELFDNLERTNLELSLAFDATIEGWSRALDLRDNETERHSQDVTSLTLELARRYGLPEQQLQHIRRGCLLHDIGKVGIPDNILNKPGKLTDEEWEVMRKHPVYAYQLLSPINFLHPAIDIPYYHHEKWDGSGYPHGLKGNEIPVAARIFALVDVYEALTHDRCYRKAWTREAALNHIQDQSGKHFDPQIVRIFIDMMREADEQARVVEDELVAAD